LEFCNYILQKTTQHKINWLKQILYFFVVFEVDESVSHPKVVTKTKMIVPDNATKKDVKKIKSVLKKSIAASVGKKDSSDLKVTLDTVTGVATTEISNLDPTSADEIKEKVNSDDFVQHVKTSIKENKADLPQEIQNKITIDNDVQPNAVVVDETTDTDVNYYVF
jgi:hypothetical protein